MNNLPDITDATQNPTPVQTIVWDTVNIPQTVKIRPIAAKITGIVALGETNSISSHILLGASIPRRSNALPSVSLNE